jgi:hypothetical protein
MSALEAVFGVKYEGNKVTFTIPIQNGEEYNYLSQKHVSFSGLWSNNTHLGEIQKLKMFDFGHFATPQKDNFTLNALIFFNSQ